MSTLWLGKIGALAALPSPRPGMVPAAVRPSTVAATIGGGQVVSFAPGSGRRAYQAGWTHLDPDTFTLLEEFFAGSRGPGPFVLLDPTRRNHLTANQSSSTSGSNGPAGFTALNEAEALGSVVAPFAGLRVPRMLKWSVPAAGGSGILRLDPPAGLPGFPAPGGEAWTFTVQIGGGGIDAAVTMTAVLLWMDAAGTPIGATIGTPVTSSATALTQASVTAGPPADAVCFQPELRLDLGTLSAQWSGFGDAPIRSGWITSRNVRQQAIGSPLAAALADYAWGGATVDVYVGQPQLDMSTAVRPWVVGTGVPQVSMINFSPVYDVVVPYASATATLVEVG